MSEYDTIMLSGVGGYSIMKKLLLFFTMIVCTVCTYNANANLVDCPEGCFCVNGGKMESQNTHCTMKTNLYNGNTGGYIQINGTVLALDNNNGQTADFYAGEFSELYIDNSFRDCFYGFLNGEFIYVAQYNSPALPCPATYPNSASGARALTECFKYGANGNKIYYGANNYENNSGNCDIAGVQTLVANLQNALNQANRAAQDLQNALNSRSNLVMSSGNTGNGNVSINTGVVIPTSNKVMLDKSNKLRKAGSTNIAPKAALPKTPLKPKH